MSFETNLNDITLILDLFKQEEYLFFSSICYFNTEDDLYNNNVNLFGYNDDLNKINKNFDIFGQICYNISVFSYLHRVTLEIFEISGGLCKTSR